MGGSGAVSFLKVLAKNFDIIAGPVVSLLFPLYASIRAIETKSPADDQQWLTYWVLYSMITLFELTFAKLIEWLPFWSYTKLIFTCWLVIPYFSGAAYVYEHYVRPYIVTRQKSVNIWYVPRKKDIFSKPDDILTVAEKYIEEHGPEAFEKMIHRSRETTSRSSKYTFYNDDYSYADDYRKSTLKYFNPNTTLTTGSKGMIFLATKLSPVRSPLAELHLVSAKNLHFMYVSST
ncbi:hypothetical protein DH2020_048294 [Rehmannia glutinosa]|uniref:HVA22-like protein n=1 Tax=Rehmannia glutinosa TaxID=99300 RepID=A0ABR0U6T7_REHGL